MIVKASAGGGGKGMRIVCDEEDLGPALEAGRREAKSAFGDDSVYLEKYIEEPRHVEFQVLADNHGEHRPSVRARVLDPEAAPEDRRGDALAGPDPELRARMGETAVRAMRAAGYNNAGTVEFLLDKDGTSISSRSTPGSRSSTR